MNSEVKVWSVDYPEELITEIPGYLDRRLQDLDAISIALENGDYLKICEFTHKIKGNAASFGLDPLGSAAIEMERLCGERDQAGIAELLNSIRVNLLRLKSELQQDGAPVARP